MKKFLIKSNKKLNRKLLVYEFVLFVINLIFYFVLDMKEDVELFILLSSLSIICYCILFVLPVFILQENYLKYNKEIELILLDDRIEINKEVIKIEFIKEVNIYATHQYFSGYVGATALIYNEYFYYMEIITYENRRYILTSLLGIELDEVIRKTYPELTFNEKVHWFPLIK